MRFFIRKRKQTPTVIIVALIDVLIVLLIFLIVTSTFKQQPSLRLALPESTQAQKSGASENAPLVVSLDAQGNLRFGSETTPVTFERLRGELAVRAATNAEVKLAIYADKAAPIGQYVKIYDVAREAKIKSAHLSVKEAGK